MFFYCFLFSTLNFFFLLKSKFLPKNNFSIFKINMMRIKKKLKNYFQAKIWISIEETKKNKINHNNNVKKNAKLRIKKNKKTYLLIFDFFDSYLF